jgi:hypothetical protein
MPDPGVFGEIVMPQKFVHPCGICDNDNCNNGHAFDRKCPKYIAHEKLVSQNNTENTRREFEQMKISRSVVSDARIRRV